MRKTIAVLGSALFFAVAPSSVARLVGCILRFGLNKRSRAGRGGSVRHRRATGYSRRGIPVPERLDQAWPRRARLRRWRSPLARNFSGRWPSSFFRSLSSRSRRPPRC